jgi:hypothetical protein
MNIHGATRGAGIKTVRSSDALTLMRVICAIIILLVVALDFASIPAALQLIQTPCGPCEPNSIQATALEVRGLEASGLSVQFYAIYIVGLIVLTQTTYIVLGGVLFLRRSQDRMALFTALTLVTFGGAAFTGTMHALTGTSIPLTILTNGLNIIGQCAFMIFLYVFPTGRFTPRWTVIPAIIWTLAWVFSAINVSPLNTLAGIITDGPAFIAVIVSMVVAQVYRYRRVSTPAQRQQTKWVVYGLGVGLSAFAVTLVIANLLLPASLVNSSGGVLFGNTLTYACFLIIPIGIALAVLRSRLYDIDILIKRTLVYGSLTAILAALYFALVIGAQTLTHRLTDQQTPQPPVVIVLSTLLIAALFQPLRHRLQRTIDRRFDRSHYDAAKTVAAFSASLRSEVNLQQLNEHLLGVVEETMRPAHASLWLRQAKAPTSELEPGQVRTGGMR